MTAPQFTYPDGRETFRCFRDNQLTRIYDTRGNSYDLLPDTGKEKTMAREFTRKERKQARKVIRNAAEAAGMRRVAFMRAVDAGDQECVDELKVSLAASGMAGEVDIDRLKEILQMILEFIKQLLAIFAMV